MTKEKKEFTKWMAKFLTVHGYRNSLIEEYHCNGKLSDKDMKKLNISVLNQIYTLLYMLSEGKNIPAILDPEGWTRGWQEPKLIKEWLKL